MTDTYTAKQQKPLKRLGGPEKAAALLLTMTKDQASRLLKHFDEEEIRLVARCASHLGTVPRATIEELATEFFDRVVTEGGLQGSLNQAQELLEGVLSPEQIKLIMSDVRSRMDEAVWPRLGEVPSAVLGPYLSKEHPQVVAFVLSKTSPVVAAGVLANFQPVLRNEIMRRLLANKLVMEPALRLLEQTLRDELLHKVARATGQTTHARIADIVNRLDRVDMDDVLDNLNTHRPKEAKIVRGLLFTFEDIAKLTDAARVTLFAEVPPERVIIALRGVEGELGECILVAIPSRTRRIIEQELSVGTNIPAKEVSKARRAIADFALELGERGVIELKSDQDQ